jgi:hypothetical protein
MYINRKSLQDENHSTDVCLPKMRDRSARSAATSSTVSSSMSDYDIEEVDITATTTPPYDKDGITCNTNVIFNNTRNSCSEDNDVDSVVSHVSSLSGHMTTPVNASMVHGDTDAMRIPLHICSDRQDENDDDDLSFAPLDDDDEDSSFAPLDDDNDDETSFEEQHQNSDQQDCPSDEEGDDNNGGNFIHRQLDRTKICNAKSSRDHSQLTNEDNNVTTSIEDVNCFNETQFIQQKALPGLNNSYKVVCVSFMEYNIATSVACKVLDEALRMLRPGGLLYVIDKGGCTVKKHPTMRQWLSRVRDPTVKHLIYEIETRAILQANGFVHTKLDENNDATTVNTDAEDWEDEEIVRWIGIKQ